MDRKQLGVEARRGVEIRRRRRRLSLSHRSHTQTRTSLVSSLAVTLILRVGQGRPDYWGVIDAGDRRRLTLMNDWSACQTLLACCCRCGCWRCGHFLSNHPAGGGRSLVNQRARHTSVVSPTIQRLADAHLCRSIYEIAPESRAMTDSHSHRCNCNGARGSILTRRGYHGYPSFLRRAGARPAVRHSTPFIDGVADGVRR